MLDEVEANAPHSGIMKIGEIIGGVGVVDQRNAGVSALAPSEGIDHGRVVHPVARGLHENRPRQPEPVLVHLELVETGIGWGVGAVGSEGKPISRTEDMAVAVGGVGRRREQGWWMRVAVRWRNRSFEH